MASEEEEAPDKNGESIPTMKGSAVLAALRAMQDKIRRLEAARDEAIEEARHAQSQLREQHEKSGAGEASLRQAYARVVEERADLERRLAAAERTASDAQERYRNSENLRLVEAQRATDSERRLRDAERSVEESLAKSAELAARAESWQAGRDAPGRIADLEAVLEATVAVNKQLVADLRAATNGTAVDANARDVVTDARAALSQAKEVLDAPRHAPRAHHPRKLVEEQPTTTTKRRGRRKPNTTTTKKQRSNPSLAPKVPRRKFKPDIPWVPSSSIESVSYNLLAACNYALRKRNSVQTKVGSTTRRGPSR